MNSNLGKQKFFLIYQISNLITGKIYVGAHVTYNINDKYFGSSKYLKKDIKELGKNNFRKEILHIFDNKEDMMNKEAEIVNKEFCHRIDTYNKMIGGTDCFYTKGMTTVKDKEDNYSLIYLDDPRYLSGELVGITKGNQNKKNTIIVRDKNDNCFQVDKSDPRYLSGELIHCNKGQPHNQPTGYKFSKEIKEKMCIAAQKRVLKYSDSYKGHICSEEVKKMMKDKFSIEFYIYDKNGNFVSKEKNIKEYATKNNITSSPIGLVLKNKIKHYKTLRFFYEYKGNLIEPLGEIGKEGRKFYVYDKNGNFISEEQNMNKYAIKNNMNCGKICEVLNKTRNSHKKYKFYNEYKGKFYDNIK